MSQSDFGFPAVPAPGLAWERFPAICRADYSLTDGGKSTGFWVRSCGHPTALRPYYVASPNGQVSKRKFVHLPDAQAAAIALWRKQ